MRPVSLQLHLPSAPRARQHRLLLPISGAWQMEGAPLPTTRALWECQGGRATFLGSLPLPQSLQGTQFRSDSGDQTRKPTERGAEAGSKERVRGTKYRQG